MTAAPPPSPSTDPDSGGADPMLGGLQSSADDLAFAAAFRTWLDENLPEGWGTGFRLPRDRAERLAWQREWQRRLDADGWVAINWPREFGGRDATFVQQLAYHAELAARRAPGPIGRTGIAICAPTIMRHGTPEQQERFLGPMRSGAEIWCQGFSEPGAGSDLAALRTRGVIDGDELVISGQKIWTSNAHIADWMFALVRTDRDAPKRQGISFVLVPMTAPGVTVRPIVQLSGDHEFSEVFLDDVRVPLANVVGGLGNGWAVTRTTLANERAVLFLPRQLAFAQTVNRIVETIERRRAAGDATAESPELRQRVARAWIDAQLIRINGARNLSRVVAGGEPGPEGSMSKLFGQEAEQRLHELALDAGGARAVVDVGGRESPYGGKWWLGYLRTRASTIGGGTSEIQRNVLAERVLGQPRDPWADE
jgi:alkylation response protein AidB-like acyl-CoA dehydrogenase